MVGLSKINTKVLPCLLGLLVIIGFMGCSRKNVAVYETNPKIEYTGSLLYVEAGCHGCHGTAWDGKTDEAKTIKADTNLIVTDFISMNKPEITVVDYYKAITIGNEKLDSAKIPHSYQSYTDAGRWAMANFLISIAPALSAADQAKRDATLTVKMDEVKKAYTLAANEGRRRWDLGYTPVAKREKTPLLNDIVKISELKVDYKSKEVSESEAVSYNMYDGRGKFIYMNNCANCHGTTGEGGQSGTRIGLIPCSGGNTNCNAYLSTKEITTSSIGLFQKSHQSGNTNLLPGFFAMNDADINSVFDYLKNK